MNRRKALDAIIVFVIAVIIILFLNPLLVGGFGIAGMAIAELGLVLVALFFVVMRKERLQERFNLDFPPIKSFFASAVLMLGARMWENAASYLYVALFSEPSNTDMEFLEAFFADASPLVALISVAVIPAVCEELLFRGYLFDSFKGKKNSVWAVIITAVLFSAIHFDIYKMAPILIMGLAFGYIAAKTGSVLIPIIFHLINNSLSLISFYSLTGEETAQLTPIISARVYLWFAVAAFGGGALLVYSGVRLLSDKPRKRWLTVTVSVLSIVIFISGTAGVVTNLVSVPYEGIYTSSLREDTVYTEAFSVEEDALGTVTAAMMCPGGVEGNVIITNSNGETVYDYSDVTGSIDVMLENGEYTVTYSFDLPEDTNVSYNVVATVNVMTVGEYESTEQE